MLAEPTSVQRRVEALTKEQRWLRLQDPFKHTVLEADTRDALIADMNGISRKDAATVYFSLDPYHDAFEETLNIRDYTAYRKYAAGMEFTVTDGRLRLRNIVPSSPAAKLPAWRSRLRGAWLVKVDGTPLSSPATLEATLRRLAASGKDSCQLLFAHPEVAQGLTNEGIPQVNLDQMNPRHMFVKPTIRTVMCGEVWNVVTSAMKLTRGRLMKLPDWSDWKESEWKQLDQYDAQGMFGEPCFVKSEKAVFRLVWTYAVKELDKRKKARCTCDGSAKAGQVRVLDHTHASCIDHTGSRMFYAIAAAENLLIFGADVSNAFGEAPPPKQGFYIRPDRAFRDWWTEHKGRAPIPHGAMIPVLATMQGHPEAGRM